MITVAYLPDRNVLCVTGIPTPFPAGSLQVRRLGDMLAVASPHQDTLICTWADGASWTDAAGIPFSDADAAYAYLSEQCSRSQVDGTAPGAPGLVTKALGGQRVVRTTPDGLDYPSSDAPETATGILGITTGACVPGSRPAVVSFGMMNEPSWAWEPGPIFLGLQGTLTQRAPATGYVLQVASAVAPTAILVGLQEPYLLAT